MTAPIAAGTGAPGDEPDDEIGLAPWRPVGRGVTGSRPRRRRLGGFVGPAFFGCLVAAAMSGLLVTVLAGFVSTLGLPPVLGGPGADVGVPGVAGIATRTAMLGTVLVSYLSGGYVASRMAGTDGALLGVAVWACAQVVGVVVLTLGALADSAGNLPSGWGGGSGSASFDLSTGAMEASTVLAVMVTALAGSMYGSTAVRRRAARRRRVG